MNTLDNRGAALPIVLFFAAFALIAVSAYVFNQLTLARPSLKKPARVQATLAARSGVWLGLAALNRQGNAAQSSAPDSIEDLFANGLFDQDAGEADTGAGRPLEEALLPDAGALVLSPFSDQRFGLCTLWLAIEGNFKALHASGLFRGQSRTVAARLGARPFHAPDTVLFLSTPGMPEGGALIEGRVHFLPAHVDSAGGRRSRFALNARDLEEMIESHTGRMGAALDTGLTQKELTITSSIDLDKIGDMVNGPLFIDATHHDIRWRARRTVTVQGDLQLTGDAHIEGVSFLVGGEVRIFDNTQLRDVTIFARERVFLAGESVFRGNIAALGAIEIYEAATLSYPSVAASFSKLDNTGAAAGGEGEAANKPSFSLFVRDRAVVDGVLLSARATGGVSIGSESRIRGIVWSEGKVCHEGEVEGVIRARNLVSREDPDAASRNFCNGRIKELESIGEYSLPYYVGELSVIDWSES
jgi:hypothetical protein